MNEIEIPAGVMQKANEWLTGNYDEDSKNQVRHLLDNEDKGPLIDAFYRDLEF